VLANGLAELVAAQPRQRRGHLLHVRNLASGQPLAAERGELEALDAGVDGGGRTHPKKQVRKTGRRCQVFSQTKLQRVRNISVISTLSDSALEKSPTAI
jgi:hypothetical protein